MFANAKTNKKDSSQISEIYIYVYLWYSAISSSLLTNAGGLVKFHPRVLNSLRSLVILAGVRQLEAITRR